jgi:tetratricopeptide (TPR) repeat protein
MEQGITFGGYRFEPSNGRLWLREREIRLTPKAAAVLAALVARAGELVTKQELFATLWPDTAVSDDALTSCVNELRKALADNVKQVHRDSATLLVIARGASFAFKGQSIDARKAGLDLGADYVVEGSVVKSRQRLRVSAHLVETEGGRHVWAERYDRRVEQVFEVQDEITMAIAARIEPEVGTVERQRAERKSPERFRAWDFFHLGLKHQYSESVRDNQEAQRLFQCAIDLDPTLAAAHAWLSYAIVLSMIYFDADPDDARLNEAVTLARKGVELDEQDALAHFVYGRALLARKAYDDALAELRSAAELNPSLAMAYCGLGDSLAYEGRIAEAIPYFEKAISLSPFDPQRWAFYSYRALAHLFAGQFESAVDWSQRATRVPHCHYWPFAHRVAALGHLEDVDALRTAKAELLERKPEFSCAFARRRLFFVKNPSHVDLYVEGLRKAGLA